MRKLWSRTLAVLDSVSLRLFTSIARVGCVPALLLALSASACASAGVGAPTSPTAVEAARPADAGRQLLRTGERGASCTHTLDVACSPYVTVRGECYDDSTRWVRLSVSGDCGLPEFEWSVAPVGHVGWADEWPWHHGDGYAYVRGECGAYRVTAAVGEIRLLVDVDLPGPLCEARR